MRLQVANGRYTLVVTDEGVAILRDGAAWIPPLRSLREALRAVATELDAARGVVRECKLLLRNAGDRAPKRIADALSMHARRVHSHALPCAEDLAAAAKDLPTIITEARVIAVTIAEDVEVEQTTLESITYVRNGRRWYLTLQPAG